MRTFSVPFAPSPAVPLRASIFLLSLFLALLLPARAQQPLAASAAFDPPTARVGQSVEFRVTITGGQRVANLPNLVPPDGLDFVPNGSTISMVELNGQSLLKNVLSFVVISRQTGEYTVPAFEVETGGQRVRVPPARLVVSEGNGPVPGTGNEPMRMVLEVPARDYYVGESIHARLLMMASADEMPTYVQQITKTSGNVLFKPARNFLAGRGQFTYQNKTESGLTMPVEIIPLAEGDIPVNCEASVQIQRLDGFSRRTGLGGASTVQSPTTNIRVIAWPKVGRPAGFTGAIGQFSISQPKLSATEVEVGEPLTVSFTVSGEGNLDGVPAPELSEDSQWRTYKPTSEFTRDDDNGKGSKTFTYTIIAKQPGKRSTPPVPFAYFDSSRKKYEDLTIPPLNVQIKAAPGAAPTPTETAMVEAAPALPPRENEPILTGLAETSGGWTRYLGPNFRFFFYAQLVPPLVLLLAWLWRRRREFLAAHPEIPLRRRARAAARRALAEARAAARRGDVPAFLRAGSGALCEAATRYRGAGAASMTPSEVLPQLEGEAALIARTIFEHSDAARYASTASEPPRPASLLSGLERAVSNLTARP